MINAHPCVAMRCRWSPYSSIIEQSICSAAALSRFRVTRFCFRSSRRLGTSSSSSSSQAPSAFTPPKGMALHVLVVGAGIGGPALAMLLQRSNPLLQHKITIVEQHPTLRTSGQQIDVKGHGVHILRRMGLLDAIKAHHTNESGLEVVDSQGKPVGFFGVSPSGERRPGLTSEYEIMRHDFVKILHEASLKQDMLLMGKDKIDKSSLHKSDLDKSRLDQCMLQQYQPPDAGLTYEFGKTITSLDQSRKDNLVHVTFSDGQTRPYDLVVGADGQGSRTRKLAFGSIASRAAFKSTGVHGAYFSIPRIATDPRHARMYSAAGRRMVFTRTGDNPTTQVLLFTMGSSASDLHRLSASYKESVEAQKDAFAASFQGSGWQMDRFLDDMRASKDFYAHEVGQIKMDRWHQGRAVLLGDSAYCPSPFTGMGATGCLAGAYVLAGELARNAGDVPRALEEYGRILRPAIDEYQALPVSMLGWFFPSSQVGGFMLRSTLKLVAQLEQMMRRGRDGHGDGDVSADGDGDGVTKDKGKTATTGWVLPEYPELNL